MNRGEYKYHKAKQAYLKEHEQWGGWWVCVWCDKWTKTPELDHIVNTGMGGSPSRLMDTENWQLLCHECHLIKTARLPVDN